jgi:hypothetical protein
MPIRRTKLFPETIVQKALVKYIKLQYPFAKDYIVMIGNGGKKTAQAHLLAAKMGERKFASDLFIAWPTKYYYGLWLEIKKGSWKITPSNKKHTDGQISFLEDMKKVGYQGDMAVGVDHGKEIIDDYFKAGNKT